jgi:hypothetical protein
MPPQRSQPAHLTSASPAPLMPQPVPDRPAAGRRLAAWPPDATGSRDRTASARYPGERSVPAAPMTCRRRGSLVGPPPTGTMTQATPSVTVTLARPRALAAVGSPQLPRGSDYIAKLVVRGGVEPPTFRFSGASAAQSLHVAGRGPIGDLAAETTARCGLVWPGVRRHWLPIWLPTTR